jgi:TonB family protein
MLPRGMLSPSHAEAAVLARSHRLLIAGLALALALAACAFAACSQDEQKAAPGSEASGAASAPEAANAPSAGSANAFDTTSLLAATRAFAEGGCATVRRKLEYCAACETPQQKPQRDLLLAYCAERESPSAARALYEALITNHPDTEASAMAIMRVRQIDAAELAPLSDYAGPKPAPIQRHQPAYPSLAQQAGIEGKVRVRFDVRGDGGVANVRVVESTPPLLFDSVALYAVTSWEFEKGRAAESQQITLRFDLTDEDVAAGKQAAGEAAAPGETAR